MDTTTVFKRALDVVEAIAKDVKQLYANQGTLNNEIVALGGNTSGSPTGNLNITTNTEESLLSKLDVVIGNKTTTTVYDRNFDGFITQINETTTTT